MALLSVFHRLVSGAGDIKLTKDGNVLLHEMVSFPFPSKNIILKYQVIQYILEVLFTCRKEACC